MSSLAIYLFDGNPTIGGILMMKGKENEVKRTFEET